MAEFGLYTMAYPNKVDVAFDGTTTFTATAA